jgi:hypothetical protein
MTIQNNKGNALYQTFSSQGLPKYTKIGIFDMQVYHLATLTLVINIALTNSDYSTEHLVADSSFL